MSLLTLIATIAAIATLILLLHALWRVDQHPGGDHA